METDMSEATILEPTYTTIGNKKKIKKSINIDAVNVLIDKIKDSVPDSDHEESDLR